MVVFIFQHLYCSHIFFINSHILSGRSILPFRVTIETQDIRIATIVGFVWVRPSGEYVAHIGCACVSYRLATFLTDIRLVLDKADPELVIPMHTDAPRQMQNICPNRKIVLLNDGEELRL